MKASGVLKRIWHWLRWPVYVLLGLYGLIVIWGAYLNFQKDKTDAAVAVIHAQKITLADVEGKSLPPVPDQAENDATVAGIDKNNNGVRDDVELAIFKKYPNSPKIRAAELQYAMTEQMVLTRIFNTGTWEAVASEGGRASMCIALTYSRDNKDFFRVVSIRTDEVDNWVFNTQARKDAQYRADDYTTSFGDAPGASCDIDLNTL